VLVSAGVVAVALAQYGMSTVAGAPMNVGMWYGTLVVGQIVVVICR
jgi:hypothetical protein